MILAAAAAVRLAHLATVLHAPFVESLIVDSREYDRWAQTIVGGDWLGRGIFFQAPLYPYFLAGIFALAGHRLLFVYLAQIALSLVGCWALYRAGRLAAAPAVGLGAAALHALYGPFVFHDVLVLKESLAVTVACCLLLALLVARVRARPTAWVAAGALLGVLALLRENALLLAPVLALLAIRRGAPPVACLRAAIAFACGFVVVMLPLVIRNAMVSGTFVPTTFQGGANLYIGNNPLADGTYRPLVPGGQDPATEARAAVRLAEAARGRSLTPAEVSSYWVGRVADWARHDPGTFLRLQWRKLALFWSWYEWPDAVDYYDFRHRSPALRAAVVELGAVELLAAAGLVLASRWRNALLPTLVFALLWCAATVVFFLFSRYRLPAVPALMLWAAVPLARAWEWRRERRGMLLALGCAAALVAPHLIERPVRLDLVETNLARLAAERGQVEEAAAHYRRVLAVAPNDLGALMGLGAHAARAGQWEEARAFFARAVLAAPDSSDAAASLGGADVALGRFDEAERELTRALRLDPENAVARANLRVLERRLRTPSPPHP